MLLLSGCQLELLSPKGDIGHQEKTLILVSLFIMLLVVVPVIFLTLYFGWRYRASNTKATYAPKWSHSTRIEVVVWTIPCVIVAGLAVLIWNTTHSLDPYKPLESTVKPIRVEAVALNWKWLFIYPDYGIASVNRLPIPVDTPINFSITAESMMNSLFIPQLGSMVYAMAGMQTKLHLIADTPGTYAGMSAAYSGPGFSDMHFDTVATSREAFDAWVRQARQSPLTLDEAAYKTLELPSTKEPATVYAGVAPGLFQNIVNKYMHSDMRANMRGDARGNALGNAPGDAPGDVCTAQSPPLAAN
ncbi:ubiquinol oxidase subunit II [Cupriavidus basilensis]|uniref:ubiquinol oxidase subunit II n=1 Tax=Cupriavidus basilensis TaxID=68895 RepID=UPI0020A65D18|nr:ubiquinol oxidase subunit II [Cupriavidus basilensis]MCP3018415.1 ubiquinol oxidase subunit II [Cupriavidus basilensis]